MLRPDAATIYNNRGLAYYDKGDREQALVDYTRAITIQPDLAEAYYNRGRARYDQGAIDQALADYTQTLALDPDFADAYTWRGYAYHKRGDVDRAIADYSRAIARKPTSVDAYLGRGMAYYAQNDLDRADTDFTHALALRSDDALALCSRGLVRRDQGQRAAALADFRACLEHARDSTLLHGAAQQVQALTTPEARWTPVPEQVLHNNEMRVQWRTSTLVDVLLGIGGVSEGVIVACAVKALGGAMAPGTQSEAERGAIADAGLNVRQILSSHELIAGEQVYFAATGITDGPLLTGVRYHGERAETHSLILRADTGSRRVMYAEHVST